MANFITEYSREKEYKWLLAEIDRLNPDLESYEGEQKISTYIMMSLDLWMQLREGYKLKSAQEIKALGLPEKAEKPSLLIRAIRYWASDTAEVYATLMLEKEIENMRLRKLVEGYKALVDKYDIQVNNAIDLADEANNVIQDVNKSILPDQRMN